jgi:hypothetical protein
LQTNLRINEPGDVYEREADRVADEVMSMSAPASESKATPSIRPLSTQSFESTNAAPVSVDKALASPGRPLEPVLRQDMERRFGYDFSRVRTRTGAVAEQSACDVNALAYTVGHDIVFGAEQFSPHTHVGRMLLAHELTHVVQKGDSPRTRYVQRQERRPRPAAIDANAQRIVNLAQDSSVPIAQRAIRIVRAIIDQYFRTDASKIGGINYDANEPGLSTGYVGRGANATGVLTVGTYFATNTTERHFARRVLQVRHEIEHIDQVRSGMAGASRSDEREFTAFYHEAVAQELLGTGRMQHSTRVQLTDAALGYYYCLSSDQQASHATRRDELTTRRAEAVRRSGRSDLGDAPSACRRQPGDSQ